MVEVPPWIIVYLVSFIKETDLSRTYGDFFFLWTRWTPGLEIFVESKEK